MKENANLLILFSLVAFVFMWMMTAVLHHWLSFPTEIAVGMSLPFGLLAVRLIIEVRIHHPENRFGKMLSRFYILLVIGFLFAGAFFLMKEWSECIKNPPSG